MYMRNILRVGLILFVIAFAIIAPVIFSGYSELKQAATAPSHLEAAQHDQAAAQRIPWRADLYELAGHEYYYAKEYSQANTAYQKAFQRHALSAQGWVAWGDINYLLKDPARAAEIWQQGLEQPDPSENLYSRLAQNYKENKDYATAADCHLHYIA